MSKIFFCRTLLQRSRLENYLQKLNLYFKLLTTQPTQLRRSRFIARTVFSFFKILEDLFSFLEKRSGAHPKIKIFFFSLVPFGAFEISIL
jgi:hypothetical protein